MVRISRVDNGHFAEINILEVQSQLSFESKLGFIANPVIQVGRPDFEDGLRTGDR